MHCVFVCVLLLIVGNASSALIRTRRDLAQDILDAYGPPPPTSAEEEEDYPDDVPPTTQYANNVTTAKVQDPGISISESDLITAFGSSQTNLKPDSERRPPPTHFSKLSENTRPTEPLIPVSDEENEYVKREILRIFGTPPPPTPEEMIENENSTVNTTGKINTDDRFLTNTQVKTQFYDNEENIKKFEKRRLEDPHHSRLGPPGSEEDRGLLTPKFDRRPVDENPVSQRGVVFRNTVLKPPGPPNHIITPTTHTNGSSKAVSSSVLLVLSYICLKLVSSYTYTT